MKKYVFILGAPDPEMAAIESLLTSAGVPFVYATAIGERCHPGNAYRHNPVLLDHLDADGATVVAVECDGTHFTIGEQDGATSLPDIRIDHHRPGDPGYGRPPEEFMDASSLGQTISLLAKAGLLKVTHEHGPWNSLGFLSETRCSGEIYKHQERWAVVAMTPRGIQSVTIRHGLVLAAAADHCLAHAYHGKCPGVDPDALMGWRIQSRAKFQGRPEAEVLADVEQARQILRDALVPPGTYPTGSECYDADGMPWPMLDIADLRGRHVPELPEAASRDGICFISDGLPGPDGRTKVVCQSGTPEQIQAFMTQWGPSEGLTDIYGDPARGFAGGYK